MQTRNGSGTTDAVIRIGALVGAATLLGIAARRRSPLGLSGATAVAVPLVMRGATGRWPLESMIARPVQVRRAITIGRPAEDIWDFWRQLENLPRFLRHLESVEVLDEKRSHWVARTPLGAVSWEAEITEETRPARLAWRSTPSSAIDTRGRLELEDAAEGRGTLLRVDIVLEPPAGPAGRLAAGLLRPTTGIEIEQDLRRFKALLEAGEIPTTDGQPHGERAFARLQAFRPAQEERTVRS
jgi:uncharacterized membrane protein